jgi:glycosyltransferase involved in cell wall biosynthesis
MNAPSHNRVLMTTDTVGGVWTYSCALASKLAESDVDVNLVTIGPRAKSHQLAMLRDQRVRLIESDLALEWQDPEGRDVVNAQRVLSGLEVEIAPDIIHLNSFREAAFDWNAPVLVVAHSCVNSWGAACNDTVWLTEPKWRHYTAAVSAGLDNAQAWVSPSRAFFDVIADLYQPCTPGAIIWNGAARGLPPLRKQNFIFAAGRIWDPAKNMLALAEAAEGLEWPLLIAGQADDNTPPGPTWLGHLPHDILRAHLQRAAVFASSALYEPFGLSVLEAASAGCALVLSDIPTFRELWGGAALFVDPMDAVKLNHVLANLCADDKRRSELQRAAYEHSLGYSLDRMASAYARLYEALLDAVPRRSKMNAVEVHA